MKIGIDARFYGTEHTGLGRYTQNVLLPLAKYLSAHELVVFLRDPYFQKLKFGKHVTKVRCQLPHYSLSEQFILPGLIKRHQLHVWFSFHFLVPVFSRIPQIVVIHDLIKTFSKGRDTTTRAPWLYAIKRLGYDLTMKRAATKSLAVIVPTNTVKNQLLAAYNLAPEKIHALWEAPDLDFKPTGPGPEGLPEKYLLYVGNAYPHKNLGVLLSAFANVKKGPELVMVTSETPYLQKLLKHLPVTARQRLHLLSGLTDAELSAVYQEASALVAPSLMEGFGLPGLEALVLGTPVIASDIPVFREVYGTHACYFDPHSPQDLAKQIKSIVGSRSSRPLKYPRTWENVAKDIGEVVNESCASL